VALIFSPLTEDVLEGPYQPFPKGVFMMLHQGKGVARIESEMAEISESVLRQRRFRPIRATSERGHKDFLVKIIQLIRGSGFGTAIFSEFTPAPTLANIFFEIALCNLLGKPVILVKSEDAKSPSDFVRTEWVTYGGGKRMQLRRDYADSVASIVRLSKYYETIGDIALDAENVDLELAFERFRQSFLINGRKSVRNKLKRIISRARDGKDSASNLSPAQDRFKTATIEFASFLGRA
jgi:hypothetical protein